MRIRSLGIENFKAIRSVGVGNLADLVVIAGPNGCGKSVVLDAIRLLKSVYGGYQYDEWRQWYAEFHINVDRPEDARRLFRDPERPLVVEAEIEFASEERAYVAANVESLVEPIVWRRFLGRDVGAAAGSSTSMELREYKPRVDQLVAEGVQAVREDLNRGLHPIRVVIQPGGRLEPTPRAPLVEVVFPTYRPHQLGIIDYHSPNRSYQRETVGTVQLALSAQQEEQRRNFALYNPQSKYANIKTELASGFVRELVARDATGKEDAPTVVGLATSMKELFAAFFPDKQFLGPQAELDGSLSFPVQLATGEVHDIDDLSSGEKEIVYGYLRLRNAAPRHSVVLLDEPELHLNPALLRAMPDFYHRHLGRAMDNQIWLVTHSDALLRAAVGHPRFSVFHMTQASDSEGNASQARAVVGDDELELATMALVGDLSTYKPLAKLVVVEGGGASEFDRTVIERLFPRFARRVNLVSGGSKAEVQTLYHALERVGRQLGVAENRFFAVVDADSSDLDVLPKPARVLRWDVYHVENYLLVDGLILEVANAVSGKEIFQDVSHVESALRACAMAVIDDLVMHRLRVDVNEALVATISLGGSPRTNPADALRESIEGSVARFNAVAESFAASELLEQEQRLRSAFEVDLASDDWRKSFPARSILSRFVHEYVPNIQYEAFRNLLLDRMALARHEPSGMRVVVEEIMSADVGDVASR